MSAVSYPISPKAQSDHFTVASVADVLAICWHEKGNIDDIRHTHELMRDFRRVLDREMGLVTIVHPQAMQRPSPAMRKQLAAQTSEHTPWVKASAIVMLGGGLATTVMRSIIAGLLLVRNQNIPTKVTATLAESAEWLAPMCEHDGVALNAFVLQTRLEAIANERAAVKVGRIER